METFIFSAIVGVFVGIASGLLGIGGGTLMVPVFRLGFGMSALASTATSLFTIIPTSFVGCLTHLKNKTCIPKLGLLAGLGGALTSPVGVALASMSPTWLVMLAAAIIIGYSSYSMFKKALRIPKTPKNQVTITGETVEQAAVEAAAAVEKESEGAEEPFAFTRKNIVTALGIGLIAGLASGYVGVGGGFIMVPLFVGVLGVMMRQASGTSLIAVTILAIPGTIEQGLLCNIDYLAGIAMAVGSIPGAIIGATFIRKIPERQLRFIFGGFLLVSAVILLANELAPLFS